MFLCWNLGNGAILLIVGDYNWISNCITLSCGLKINERKSTWEQKFGEQKSSWDKKSGDQKSREQKSTWEQKSWVTKVLQVSNIQEQKSGE